MTFSRSRKALVSSAFFIACFFFPFLQATGCPAFKASETAVVKYVHDGDTLHLADKRKVRLIGIDTPELARRSGNRFTAVQPFAEEARDYARKLIAQNGKSISLMPGIEANDRYGRFLYHIQLADGSLLQSRLIEAGLAVAYTTPPNTRLSDCYKSEEKKARNKKAGFWAHEKYQPVDVTKLSQSDTGFHIIRGKITHSGESRKAFWLNFGNYFAARIDKRDIKNFDTPLKKLVGKTVLLKGWVRVFNNRKQVSLRHPSALSLISE